MLMKLVFVFLLALVFVTAEPDPAVKRPEEPKSANSTQQNNATQANATSGAQNGSQPQVAADEKPQQQQQQLPAYQVPEQLFAPGSVHFSAARRSAKAGRGHIVPFEFLWVQSYHNAFDMASGKFKAPTAGVYTFQYSGAKNCRCGFADLDLFKGHEPVVRAWAGVGTRITFGNSATVFLCKDEEVYLRLNGTLYSYPTFDSTFSGHLVHWESHLGNNDYCKSLEANPRPPAVDPAVPAPEVAPGIRQHQEWMRQQATMGEQHQLSASDPGAGQAERQAPQKPQQQQQQPKKAAAKPKRKARAAEE